MIPMHVQVTFNTFQDYISEKKRFVVEYHFWSTLSVQFPTVFPINPILWQTLIISTTLLIHKRIICIQITDNFINHRFNYNSSLKFHSSSSHHQYKRLNIMEKFGECWIFINKFCCCCTHSYVNILMEREWGTRFIEIKSVYDVFFSSFKYLLISVYP